jgi:Mg-chelatase subunit ChlI
MSKCEEGNMARTELTRKELILRMIEKLPDDVTYDRVMYHLDVLKAIETGIEQIEKGEYITHAELEQRLREKGWLDEPDSDGPQKPRKTSKKSSASSAAVTPRGRRGRSPTS